MNGSVHWCVYIQIHKYSHIQTITRWCILKRSSYQRFCSNTHLPFPKPPSLLPSLFLSPSASTLMQKTLMSLWGFATAHFHGKSSVLCLCQHCQVLIIHRNDSQSKAETQMSLCHRAPLDERKHVFILEEKEQIHTDRPPNSRVHSDDRALSRCIKQWPCGSNVRGNRFTDCGKLIIVSNYLPSFMFSWIFHMLKRPPLNLAKRESCQIVKPTWRDIHQLPC